MIKLAFTTLGCPDWNFEKILDEAVRLGFSAIDIRGIEGKMNADEIPYFQIGNQQETAKRVAQRGLTMCCYGCSASFHDRNNWAAAMRDVRTAVDVCKALNIPYVRVFGNNVPAGRDEQEVIDTVAEGLQLACDYAEGTGVTILLEVHGEFNTIERVAGVAKKMRGNAFGILWDVAHSDKIYKENFADFYQAIKPWVRHIHLKDHIRINTVETKLVPTGEGDIPLADIIHMLENEGYDGYYSLEWEKKWHPDLPDAEVEFPHFVEWIKEHI